MLSRAHAFNRVSCRFLHQVAPEVFDTAAGIRACTATCPTPLSSVSVVVKAGVRSQATAEEQGQAFGLRSYALASNSKNTKLANVTTLDKTGGQFTVSLSRELLTYNLTCEEARLKEALPVFSRLILNPEFPQWDVKDLRAYLNVQKSVFDEDLDAVLVNNLHKSAFRRGLGNSLNATNSQISNMSQESLMNYHTKCFNPSNVFVAIANAAKDDVAAHFQKLDSTGQQTKQSPSKYHAGDSRHDVSTSDDVRIALACQGGAANSKESAVGHVLASILSNEQVVSHGSPLSSVAQQFNNFTQDFTSFNYEYSDAGLFGVYLRTPGHKSGDTLKNLHESLNNLKSSLTADHVEAGKNAYMRRVMNQLDDPSTLLEHIASNILLETQTGHDNFEKTFSQVSVDDVKGLINRLTTGPRNLAAVGNCTDLPYLDEL